MKINKVKNAIKIGDFYLKDKKLNINYCVDRKILNDDSPRVYLIVENGVIKKIGGSSSVGGIKSTMSFYLNATKGSPGRPRFIIHQIIKKRISLRRKLSLYMIQGSKGIAKVKTLFESKKIKVSSFKEMEKICLEEYYNVEKKYPDWNFQENKESYPKSLEKKYNKYHEKRLSKKR